MAKQTNNDKGDKGIEYIPRVKGKYLFRVRETYVAGPVADLIRSRRFGAVKLDLILRGLALLPRDAGNREPGLVLRNNGRTSYQALHDLCRSPAQFSFDLPHSADDDATEREKKRTWVGEQLQELQSRQLVRREPDPQGRGRRPELIVLSDRGDGTPFDDPGETSDSYVIISGGAISSPFFRGLGAAELVAYLCAMTADRFARYDHFKRTGEKIDPGAATWFRQADWFNSTNPNFSRPEGHVAYPFSTTTIERGLRSLSNSDEQFLQAWWSTINPQTGQPFASGRRKIYQNRFSALRQAEVFDLDAYRAAS